MLFHLESRQRLWPTLGFFIVVPGVLSLAWAQESPKPPEARTTKPTETKRAPKRALQVSSPAPEAPTSPLLREGTAVKLKLLHTRNSKTVVVGDPLNFSVAEDVVVDGIDVVKVGPPAVGRVRQAKPGRTMGRAAELGLEVHGSEIEVKEGSLFTVYVDQDTIVPAPPVTSAPE
jgi:hypothetical protein